MFSGDYAEQSPVHMVSAARLAGVPANMPDDDDPVHYLELGCGLGIAALTHPHSRSIYAA
jgi:hypothetical protein